MQELDKCIGKLKKFIIQMRIIKGYEETNIKFKSTRIK